MSDDRHSVVTEGREARRLGVPALHSPYDRELEPGHARAWAYGWQLEEAEERQRRAPSGHYPDCDCTRCHTSRVCC